MLIDLSNKLGMQVVAEGIESEAQAKRLQEFGCYVGQGYYFARPSDAVSITRLPHASMLKRAQFENGPQRLKA